MRESSEFKNTAVPHHTESELFTEIYNSYHRKVHEVAYQLCRCSFVSEEITQEVFIKLWVKKEYIHEIKDPGAWLFTTTRNLCVDHLRRKKLAQAVFREYSFIQANDPFMEELNAKEMLHVIIEAIEQLHPQQKRVYKLKRYHGLKREAIAKQLNISEHTVRNHMQKALCSVKKYVKDRVA